MHVETTFWSDEVHTFEYLFYVRGSDKRVMFAANLNDVRSTLKFFEDIADFVVSATPRKALREWNRSHNAYLSGEWYQFAVGRPGGDDLIFVKWFDLVVTPELKISHDTAFDTSMAYKNGHRLSFGGFPIGKRFANRKLPKYRKLLVSRRVYKYFANQVRTLLWA